MIKDYLHVATVKENNDGEKHEDKKKEPNDPHIWLNPLLVKIQTETIKNTLIELDPPGKTEYEANYLAFIKDLDSLHNDIINILAPVNGKKFLVFHPAFGYFADAYDIEQITIEIEGKEPSARQLAGIIELVKKENISVFAITFFTFVHFILLSHDCTSSSKMTQNLRLNYRLFSVPIVIILPLNSFLSSIDLLPTSIHHYSSVPENTLQAD